MTRTTTRTLTAVAAAAVAVLAPAAGHAADRTNALRGAPQMHVVNAEDVRVSFVTDKRITSRDPRVVVADHGTAVEKRIVLAGRHGDDFRYVAKVRVRRPMTVGRTYTVRFAIAGESSIERKVLLRAKKPEAHATLEG